MRSLLLSLPLMVLLVTVTPTPSVFASDGWCDTDPILVVRTPAGRLVPVYVNVGAKSLLFTPNTLLSSILPAYTAVPSANKTGTTVSVTVTVPKLVLDVSFATRSMVTTGALGTGSVYASTTGVSGQALITKFDLPYR
jgi:hypothetical protein